MQRPVNPHYDSEQSDPSTIDASQPLHSEPPSDLYFFGATAPPPSEPGFFADDHANHDNKHSFALSNNHHSIVDIINIANDSIAHVGAIQTTGNTSNQFLLPSQYCNKLRRPVPNKIHPVISRLESGDLFVRIVIGQNDTLKSIKSQIALHKHIFERKGYPDWSKDILGPTRHFNNHSWCHLVFRGALKSHSESVRSEVTEWFSACEKTQRALDAGTIQRLPDYIQVLKSLDHVHERVQKYGMCSSEYQITVRSGHSKNEHLTFIASPAGCRISDTSSEGFEVNAEKTSTELVVWPPPASGRLLRRTSQIVRLQVAKEIAASKFQDLELRHVEDLGLEKLEGADLKLLLNTPRFANGAAMLAHKFYLGNHISNGFMSNLARHWLLSTSEGKELAFKHLLLIPDRASMELVRVIMAAVDVGTTDEIRTLCLELSARKHVWDCCEAISSAPIPCGIIARARLCLECLDPAVMNAVWNLNRDEERAHNAGVIKFLLSFAETDVWKLRIKAFLHLTGIGATDYSAARHADQIYNDQAAKKLEHLAQYLKHSDMRSLIINASRTPQDLEVYVQMLNTAKLPPGIVLRTLLMRLVNAVGYIRVAELNVPIERGMDQQLLASWLMSGPSDGLCLFGDIYVQNRFAHSNLAPARDHELHGRLTENSRMDQSGRWEFFQGYREESNPPSHFRPYLRSGGRSIPIWTTLLQNDSSAKSHAHLSEQLYFHANEKNLPNAQGLGLIKFQTEGVGDLVGQGLDITSRIARDIWHLGSSQYYSMSRGRLWKLKTEGGSCRAVEVGVLSGNFLEMTRGTIAGLTIS